MLMTEFELTKDKSMCTIRGVYDKPNISEIMQGEIYFFRAVFLK